MFESVAKKFMVNPRDSAGRFTLITRRNRRRNYLFVAHRAFTTEEMIKSIRRTRGKRANQDIIFLKDSPKIQEILQNMYGMAIEAHIEGKRA